VPKACRVAVVAWVATALAVSLAQGQALSPSDCGAAAQYYLSRASQRSLPQWQGARLGQPIPCFHVTGGTSAYVFPVLKGGQEVGYVGVAAELDSYPLIRAATTPGPQARVERGLQIAARELGPAARFVGLVYAGDLDFYGLYEVEGARRLAVNLMTGESGPPEALASAFAQVQAAQAPANEARRRWRELLSPGPQAVETAKVEGAYVANVPEYTWYRSCVPTSVGMLLGYLGNQRRALNYPTSSFDWLGPDNEAWSCTTARELVDQIADLTPNSDKGPIPREGGVERNYEIRREDLLGGASTVINRHGYWAHWQTKDKFDWGAYKDWVGYGPVLILTRKFNCGGWDLGGGHAFVGIGWDSTSGENCVLLYDANDNLLTAWDTEPPKRTPGFPPPANPPGYPPASYPKVQYLPASCLGGIWWWRKGIFMGGCTGTDKLQFFVSFDGPVPVGCGPASRGGQTELWVYPYWPLPLDTGGFFPLLVPALGSFSKNGYDFPPALRFEVGGQNATVLAATCSGVLKGYRVSFKWPGVPWDPGWETDFHDYPLTVRVGDSSRTLPGVIRHRSPVPRAEIAIVLDRSETVTGAKLTRAKDAACALINQIEPETRFGLYVFPWPGYTAGRWGPPTYSPSLGFPSDHSRQVTCDWLQELRPVQGDGLCAALEGIAEHWENANGPGWQGMPRAVVVLSDGYDSQPCSDELRGGAISVNKRFYTLGYGDCNEQRLRDIATFGAGASYHHDLDPSYMPALYRAIVRSWASLPTIQAAGQSQSSTGDTFRYNFDVSAGTVSITVLVDPANCWNQFDVSLTKPDGQPLDMNDGRVYSQTPYGCAFEAVIYDPDPGTWEVTVEARNITYQADSGFKVTISAESDIGLYLAADRSECCSGDPILLSATFTDNGEPVTGATVRAEIANLGTQLHPLQRGLPPRGTLELLDDGEHGDGGASDGVYADWYTDALPVRGEPYTFFARGTADDGQGHTIERRSGDVQITVKAGQSDPGLALSPQSWQVGQITNTGSAELVCTVTTTGTDPVLVQALPSPVTVEGTNGAGQSPNPVTVSWEPLPAAPAPPTLGGSPVTSLQEEETPLFLPEDVAAVLPGTPRNCRLSFQPSLDAPAGRYWCDVIFSTAQGTARLPVEADLVRTACISGAVHGLWTLGTQQYPPSVAPEVVLKQSGAEVTRMVSETVGTYMFSGVSPGVYDLQAEAPGCAPVLRPGVNVLEGQHVVCDLALAPADPLPAGLSLFGIPGPGRPSIGVPVQRHGHEASALGAPRKAVLRVARGAAIHGHLAPGLRSLGAEARRCGLSPASRASACGQRSGLGEAAQGLERRRRALPGTLPPRPTGLVPGHGRGREYPRRGQGGRPVRGSPLGLRQ